MTWGGGGGKPSANSYRKHILGVCQMWYQEKGQVLLYILRNRKYSAV